RVARNVRGDGRARVSGRADIPRAVRREKVRCSVDDEFAGGFAPKIGERDDDHAACRETEICVDGWIGAVFVWTEQKRKRRNQRRGRRERRSHREEKFAAARLGGSGVYAERGAANDLRFDAGG